MTKRSLESDIDELSEQVLGDLSPIVRMQLMLQAKAEDRQAWVDRLRKTCPTYQYEMKDVAFMNRLRMAMLGGLEALYDLHLGVQRIQTAWLYEDFQGAMLFSDSSDLAEQFLARYESIPDPIERVAKLARDYWACSQFAEETLGISLETWLGMVADVGPGVVMVADSIVTAYADQLLVTDGPDEQSAEAAADELFETLTDIWEEDASCWMT